uniref:NADH dehydrogenase [ubiquinone] 1 alpha subcomplex subunit 5 n=1 Tax=Chloropicon laureae TaxID=464258 RepID=A0A7S2Z7E0_9CHLO|mmetsp:Transcript_8121/g.20831  ORF Transcript_8121/g.20831 Transcript_8121/m.20831 type:complete len:163 (+) Transcript_8121:57-545(+)|eukprot:CAMPEP_0197485114 /NCGR_PEP_ID=MMETSP1311-20131121/112_1 /TAXON_ID=464262 /ORGANISM="Genus nov. species nov., Strain RCC856" /LENGTH=162 /DNA_ID=CAMNT_0043027771 /DNA_START=64 /DNA_END=552 /DNA_ORIENTATION=-
MALLQNAVKASGLARLWRGAAASLTRATGQDLAPFSVGYKTTTGIVGVEVDPQAPETLRKMLKQILREVKVIPENAQYRVSVEVMANERLEVVSKDIPPEQMEEEIGAGQLEELILQAKDELSLIPKMAEWKPWVVPEGHKIKMVVDDAPIPPPEPEGEEKK